MRRHSTRGFTLIEMLAVIAVVMLLAVLLFPCGCPTRPVARTASCPNETIRLFQNRHRAAMRWSAWLGNLIVCMFISLFR